MATELKIRAGGDHGEVYHLNRASLSWTYNHAKMAHIQLTDLPDEVIQTVLYQLTYTGALALEATCRRFRDVSNEPLLWKRYCQQSFKKWRSGDVKARSASKDFTGWKLLFEERMRTNKNIRNLMNGVIDIGTDRIRRLENITRLGYDAKEALIEGFKNAHLHTGDVLARRWACSPVPLDQG